MGRLVAVEVARNSSSSSTTRLLRCGKKPDGRSRRKCRLPRAGRERRPWPAAAVTRRQACAGRWRATRPCSSHRYRRIVRSPHRLDVSRSTRTTHVVHIRCGCSVGKDVDKHREPARSAGRDRAVIFSPPMDHEPKPPLDPRTAVCIDATRRRDPPSPPDPTTPRTRCRRARRNGTDGRPGNRTPA